MKAVVMEKNDVNVLLKQLSQKFRVFGPTQHGPDFIFEEVLSAEELCLDCVSTILPPKKFFHPAQENLFSFTIENGFELQEFKPDENIFIFGIHPCDVNAILRQDKFFSEDFEDIYYTKRRDNSVIAAINCIEPGDNCFCSSMCTGPYLERGYDLLFTDIGEKYLIEIGNDIGSRVVEGMNLKNAKDEDFIEKETRLKIAESKFKKTMNTSWLAKIALSNLNHQVWTDLSKKGGVAGSYPCLSCGSCSLVCPTCYCYEVYDVLNLSLKGGIRKRELDSCQLLEYGEVAQGGNFRKDRKDRIRHWMLCKFGAAAGRIFSSCVGCGRCITVCPSRIDITEVAKRIRGE